MINRAKMPRQLRGKGGITNITPRKKYGLGSKLKDRFRKLIPNELASVAVKAAPFVAPFNPAIAGLMRGIGRFDQRGSISDALKQGLATTAFGAGTRFLGGADQVMGGGLRGGFTPPLSQERTQAIGNLFNKQKPIVDQGEIVSDAGFETGKKTIRETAKNLIKKLPKGVAAQLAAGTVTAGASLLASYFQGNFREQEPGETMEDYLAARRETVGQQMRTYMDSYFKFDPEYSALDDAGRDAFVARYNVRDGGMPTGIMRTNKAGVKERDYRDKGGFVPVGIKEKADDVPAMLSKNEFVMTADAVRGAGNGSIEKGAQRMYNTMKRLEKKRA
jgi:hypothetical protein|tara:strand:- start:737 stop:1732 length:996 start_codon:yes stop_codon:yes gene_type:complete